MKENLAIHCLSCNKKLATSKEEIDNHEPRPEILYKNGNILIPNLGWFCSQNCTINFELNQEVKFNRNKDGKIDSYKEYEERQRIFEKKANTLMSLYYVIVGVTFLGPPAWVLYSGGFTLKSVSIILFVYLFYYMLYYSKKHEQIN